MNSYFAFISYAREDSKIASWLHLKLEKYPYPQEMVAPSNRPSHEKYLRKIFFDVKDLPVREFEFTMDIKHILEEARYLIVICSKNSIHSTFVQKEINYFLSVHEGRMELVLPVFVNSVEGNVPTALVDSDVLKRNCPIYNTKLTEKSEANLYCFYHIVSFLLKVDFTKLYDRYESYARKKRRYKTGAIIVFILLLLFSILFLYLSLNRQRELTKRQQELTEFEKTIFPLSIVFGYEKNFLSPTIEWLKQTKHSFDIYILMPYHVEDLRHQDRIARVGDHLKEVLGADSIYSEKLQTRMKRGTFIGRISLHGQAVDEVYVDFASTTSTFMQILDYKLQRYPDLDKDKVIQDYANTFIRQTKELLGADSVHVHFFVSQEKFVQEIQDVTRSKRIDNKI